MDQNRADNIPPFTGNSIATTKRTEFCPCIKAVVLQVVLYGNVTPHLNARYKADVLPALLYSAPSNITLYSFPWCVQLTFRTYVITHLRQQKQPRLKRVDQRPISKDELPRRRFGIEIKSVYFHKTSTSTRCAVNLKTSFELGSQDKFRA